MKNFAKIILVLIFTAAISAQEQTSDKSKDETAIRANVGQMQKGWNAKSGAEFAKPFAENADYVVINGLHLKGRQANATTHQQIFDTIYKDSNISLEIEQIRFLRPDVAVVHVHGILTLKTEVHHVRITLVMTKSDGRWEIAAFQNTAVQAVNQTTNK